MQVNSKITFFVPDFENPIETSFISSEIKAGFPRQQLILKNQK